MNDAAQLTIAMERHPVTLHYPGSEGVVFHDAVLALRNDGPVAAPAPGVRLCIRHDEAVLYEGSPDPASLKLPATLAPGEAVRASFFLLLKREVRGFGSKVNFFGYRSALDWSYDVTATPLCAGADAGAQALFRVCWRRSATEADLVEVTLE